MKNIKPLIIFVLIILALLWLPFGIPFTELLFINFFGFKIWLIGCLILLILLIKFGLFKKLFK
jgi:hypothetical protein